MRKVVFLNEKDVETLKRYYDLMSNFATVLGYDEIDEVGVDMALLAIEVAENEYPQNRYVGSVQVFCEKELK